jgi:hypothetical protein
MKTGAIMRRALDCCAPFLFGLTIMLFVGTVAQAQGDVSAVPELEAAHNRVQEATMTMEQAEAQNNTQARERARIGYSKANQNMAQTLAHVAGVRTEDVSAMQKAGMGWAQIAQELGLQPAHLGIAEQAGRQANQHGLNLQDRTRDRERDRELSEATSRNMRSLGDTKHGMAMVGSGSKGMGLGYAKGAMSAGASRGFGGQGPGSPAGHGGNSGSGGSGGSGGGSGGSGGSGGGGGNGGAGGGGGR